MRNEEGKKRRLETYYFMYLRTRMVLFFPLLFEIRSSHKLTSQRGKKNIIVIIGK